MSDNAHKGFTELEVWKKSRSHKNEINELVKTFPPDEKYRLTDQIIRSSRSINAAISEGHGRFTYKDQIHFCIIARGSLSETLNHLIDAFDCGFIKEELLTDLTEKISEIQRLLNGYISYLKKNIS